MPVNVRVCSYNIHTGAGMDGRRNLERIGDVIRRTGADLVGIQEVDRNRERTDRVDQIGFLADYLDMDFAYGPAMVESVPDDGSVRQAYGIGILSDQSLVDVATHTLPHETDAEPRVLLSATAILDAPSGEQARPVSFATTHLGLDATNRERQASEIIEILGQDPDRTILVGDFNALPDSPTIDTVTGAFQDTLASVGAGGVQTFPTPYVERGVDDNYLSVFEPNRRIDYIFQSPDIQAIDGRIVESLASDHSAVVAELRVPDPE